MNTIKKNTNFIFILVICFLIIIFIGYVALYFVGIQGNRLSDKIEDYSGFGSYLGGVSSIFSVFSILFLIWTYRKDKNESLIKEEENKLTRYFEYLISAKAHIKGSYKQKEYSKEEIRTAETLSYPIFRMPKRIFFIPFSAVLRKMNFRPFRSLICAS